MIVSTDPIPTTSRWLHARILLTALTLLPLGVAYAQGSDGEDSEVDCEAFGARLNEMVANGELTAEEAGEQYSTACERDETIEGHLKKLGIDDATIDRIRTHLTQNEFTDEQVEQTLQGLAKYVDEIRKKGEFELDPRIRDYLQTELGLVDEQIEIVVGLSRRIAITSPFKPDNGETMWRPVRGALMQAGIEREKIRDVIGAITRIFPMYVNFSHEAGKLDPAMREYFESIELTNQQIELVVSLSRGVAARPEAHGNSDAYLFWMSVADALIEAGVEDNKGEFDNIMEAMTKIIAEIQSEGDAFELDSAMREYLEGIELTDEQIEFVVGFSKRLASR